MKINNLLIIIYIFFSTQKKIKNGVYIIVVKEYYLCYYKRKIYVSSTFHINNFFRITKKEINLIETFYNIEPTEKKIELSVTETKNLMFSNEDGIHQLWNIIKVDEDNFIIKNIDNCFVLIDGVNVFCQDIPDYKATKFKFIKIYNEDNENTNYKKYELINKEPIDILIKYIDLRDPNLKRNGIHQINKDYDNEELRYSLRSIFDNIPWVRKIFILMPNEKVRFLKDYNLIKEKIIYVKDKDFLGYDSSNYNAFLFRYWKMKNFGISDNIIVMDDDCFFNNKLKKTDFFHVQKGKVVPTIITSNFLKINHKYALDNYEFYEKRVKNNKEEQGDDEFNYSKFLTFEFILKTFNISLNESIFIPKFTHNAIPVNLNDVKEIYDLAYKSKHRYNTLDCLYRISGYLQFQMLILSYTFLRYHRKVKNIPNNFILINDSISTTYKLSLFCINKGPGEYTFLNFYKEKIALEYLFPNPSPYELVDYSIIDISYNITYTMEKKIKLNEKRINGMLDRKEVKFIFIYFVFFNILIAIKFMFLTYFTNF